MLRGKHNATPNTKEITTAIYLLSMLIILSRHLVLVLSALAAISSALAAYDFMTGNTGWGIVDALLAFGDIIFLVQLKHK
jgi:hypothetical protein